VAFISVNGMVDTRFESWSLSPLAIFGILLFNKKMYRLIFIM
jgi:hypothetical protein